MIKKHLKKSIKYTDFIQNRNGTKVSSNDNMDIQIYEHATQWHQDNIEHLYKTWYRRGNKYTWVLTLTP